MKAGALGRADLLEAYRAGGPELQAALARFLGMARSVPEPIAVPAEVHQAPAVPPLGPPPPAAAAASVPFWRAETYTRMEPPDQGAEAERVELAAHDERPKPAPLAFRPLATPAAVLTNLGRASNFVRATGDLDLERVVDHLSRGRFPGSWPRRSRKTWGQSIHVVFDDHEHLEPYREDQRAVVQVLRRVYPRDGVDVVALGDGASQPGRLDSTRSAAYRPPEPGTTVLALSDLGALAFDRVEPRKTWLALGKLYRERGTRPIALVPCDLASIPLELTCDWVVIPWESHALSRAAGLSPDQVEEVSRRALALLSYAMRLEPVLIREVRRLLVKGRLGAGVEARVWQDPALRGQEYDAPEFQPGQAREFQRRFENEPADVRRDVVALLRRAHIGDYEFLWFLERLALESETDKLNLKDDDLGAAVRWVRTQQGLLEADAEKRDPTSDESLWFRRAFLRLPEFPVKDGSAGDSLHKIFTMTTSARDQPPAGLDPVRAVVRSLRRPLRTAEVRHAGDRLIARPFENSDPTRPPGSLIGLIRTRLGRIKVEEYDDFWESGGPPGWADDWGRDSFGAWVTLRVGDVVQRLRWAPPGKFWMGSPEDEEGRYPGEGPRHEEAIASGFWMFDTPCTQALWGVVMGENPSHFAGPNHPVESVSWNACREFLKRLNERHEGLEFKLPSEPQWEYACRAGTETPRYHEELGEIAWYSKNSQNATHPVGQLVPNDWGLYDTLGNVFEWCDDIWTDDYDKKKNDSASAHRVVRGGSWRYHARGVRAAYRNHYEPSARGSYLGFRCAVIMTPRPAGWKRRGEQMGEQGGARGDAGARDQASGAGWMILDAPGKVGVSILALTPVRLSTDVEQIVLRPTTRPKWASAIGRDRYGLWAEFTIEGPSAKRAAKKKSAPIKTPPGAVRQRLRWAPPGRFLMGPTADEEGRSAHEGPQHEVTIADGFWMFDTPCTQALWEALMGENPSEFKSPDRPVENVSWGDCERFVKTINDRFRREKVGLSLSLPSESQWEYACRAGTTTATYAGPLKILGTNNVPILHDIAWYRGNSGRDFELSNGRDASGWPDKQFAFDKAGTRPVALKEANPWGLYDMLGNVWEWCKDVWVEDDIDSVLGERVMRGGSWDFFGQFMRASYRLSVEPSSRHRFLGFRCSEFREGVVSGASRDSRAPAADPPATQ